MLFQIYGLAIAGGIVLFGGALALQQYMIGEVRITHTHRHIIQTGWLGVH